MHYSKIFFIILIFFLNVTTGYCENWEHVYNDDRRILIDTDSVNYHNNSLYYNVRYYEESAGEDIVATIQAINGNAGIVQTCKFSDYQKNKNLANAKTDKVPSNIKNISPDSLLFNANSLAKEIYNKQIASSTIPPVPKPNSSIPPIPKTNANFSIPTNSTLQNTENSSDSKAALNSHAKSKKGRGKNSKVSAEEVDFGPYMKELQRRIKMNWEPPKTNKSKHVVLLFSIARDGRLLNVKVQRSSGLQSADDAAIKAVKLTAPFRPLPAEFKGNSVDIQFTFDYNVKI